MVYKNKDNRVNWRNIKNLRINGNNLHEDPAFEDSLKNFISSRLVEDDLDKIGDERMLKIVLLDQLMIEYLMGIQESLLEENGALEQKHALALKTKDAAAKQLEENKKKIDELREEEGRKEEKLKGVKTNRQKVASFKCPYCQKMFKNLFYLEKHMVKNEASQMRLERNLELASDKIRLEQERAKEDKKQQEIAHEKKKELDIEGLKKELEDLKKKQEQDQRDKQAIEDRLQRVNTELSKELKKFEGELADQTKKLQDKQKTEEQTKAELERVKQEISQKIQGQNNIQHAPASTVAQTNQSSPVVKQEAPVAATEKQDPPNLSQLKDIVKMNIEMNKSMNKNLVKALQSEKDSSPHSLIIDLVKSSLVQQRINPEDPVGDKPDQKKLMELVNLITTILDKNEVFQTQPPHGTIPNSQPVVQPAPQKGTYPIGVLPKELNNQRELFTPGHQTNPIFQSEETSHPVQDVFGHQLNQQNRKAIINPNLNQAYNGNEFSEVLYDSAQQDPTKFFEKDRAPPKPIVSHNKQDLLRSTIKKRGDIQ